MHEAGRRTNELRRFDAFETAITTTCKVRHHDLASPIHIDVAYRPHRPGCGVFFFQYVRDHDRSYF